MMQLLTLVLLPGALALQSKSPQANSSSSSSPVLPEVDDVLRQPGSIMKDLSSKLELLAKHVTEAEQTSVNATREQRAAYEKSLAARAAENDKDTRSNEHIKSEISAIRSSNTAVRAHADKLISENAVLSEDLARILSNITLAEEFAKQAITNGDASMNESAPELSVLTELATRDSASRKTEEHAKKLSELDTAARKMALISMQGKRVDEDPQQMVESLLSQFNSLKNEQKTSETALAGEFDKAMKVLDQRHAEIIAEQAELNATKASLLNISNRLLVAEKQLQATRETLLQRGAALRHFSLTLGNRPLPIPWKAPSFLQISEQSKPAALPGVSNVLQGPRQVLGNLSSHVKLLEESLAAVNQQAIADAQEQKATYEHTLAAQRDENQQIEHLNSALASDVKKLKDSNKHLRHEAEQLVTENTALKKKLTVLLANISTAHEFTANSLSEADVKLHNSTEVQVLSELDSQDALRSKEMAHVRSLNAISGSKLVMLELGATRSPHKNTQEMLAMLSSTLSDLEKEQNASMASLKESFNASYKKGEARRRELLDEQSKLNSTKETETELNLRLTVALDHLTQMHNKLQEQSNSVHRFMQGIGTENTEPKKPAKATKETVKRKAGLLQELAEKPRKAEPKETLDTVKATARKHDDQHKLKTRVKTEIKAEGKHKNKNMKHKNKNHKKSAKAKAESNEPSSTDAVPENKQADSWLSRQVSWMMR